MSDVTLPPEQLPIARTEDAEVVVCRGAARCSNTNAIPCAFCIRINAEDATVDGILAELDHLH